MNRHWRAATKKMADAYVAAPTVAAERSSVSRWWLRRID
jgi:hypothetical protein